MRSARCLDHRNATGVPVAGTAIVRKRACRAGLQGRRADAGSRRPRCVIESALWWRQQAELRADRRDADDDVIAI
jgi:hypothetical protein